MINDVKIPCAIDDMYTEISAVVRCKMGQFRAMLLRLGVATKEVHG